MPFQWGPGVSAEDVAAMFDEIRNAQAALELLRERVRRTEMDAVARLIRVCVFCAMRPDGSTVCYGQDEPGRHAFVEREPCGACGGAGGRGGLDPQTRETCDVCEGVGVEGIV